MPIQWLIKKILIYYSRNNKKSDFKKFLSYKGFKTYSEFENLLYSERMELMFDFNVIDTRLLEPYKELKTL